MMSRGLLDAIFATSTVAAGVDFPARTVVLTVADMRTNDGWRPLGASEFQQMTGRAGRRGRDQVGFIVAATGRHQNPQRIVSLLSAPPDNLQSQFRATYTSLLNLLDAYGSFASVREIVERSFAHVETARRLARLATQARDAETRIETTLSDAGCDVNPRIKNAARSLERLASARGRIQEALPETREETAIRWLDEAVVPGRVVRLGRSGGAKGKRLVFVTERNGMTVSGLRENGARATFALDRTGRVFRETYKLADAADAFLAVHERRNLPLHEPRRSEHRAELDDAVEVINKLIEQTLAEANAEVKEKMRVRNARTLCGARLMQPVTLCAPSAMRRFCAKRCGCRLRVAPACSNASATSTSRVRA
jgi:superfamily II RNA helicase